MINQLLKQIPKKYHNRIEDIYTENGLIDNCKYMLEFTDDYRIYGDYQSIPCKSIKEVKEFLKQAKKIKT